MFMSSMEKFTLENMLENNVYGRFASFFKNYELKEADKYIKRVFPNAEFYLDYEHALVFERIGEDKEIDLDYHTVINGIAYDGTFTSNYNELVKYFEESVDESDYEKKKSKVFTCNGKKFEQEVLKIYPSSIEITKIKDDQKKEKNNMELKETVELMNSENYKERFVAEYHQVKIRYEKLKNFCNKIEVEEMLGKEVTKHDCPLELLREQQKYMGLYLSILEKRALIENVEL